MARVKQWGLNDVHFDKLIHARKKHTLHLEPTLVVRISEDKEDILNDAKEVLLEEGACNRWVRRSREVVDDVKTH